MARPKKEGMDYFPHDVDASNDEKIEMLEILYGNDGYSFYFKMLERIYKNKNFCLVSDAETREEMFQILSKKFNMDYEKFQKILNSCFKYKLFDKELYETQGIITNESILKRSKVVTDKRKSMAQRYQNTRADADNEENEEIVSDAETQQKNGRKTAESTQSKVKESKEKNIYIVFDKWNSLEVGVKHKDIKDFKASIEKAIKNHSLEKVLEAIERLNKAIKDNDFYYNHKWNLKSWLTQGNGITNWLDEGQLWNNYGTTIKPKTITEVERHFD